MSVGAAAATATGDTGRQRVAQLFEPAAEIAGADLQLNLERMSNEITRLRSEQRLLALEKEALQIKIAALESAFGPVTGSIPDVRRVATEEVADLPPDVGALLEGTSEGDLDVGFGPLPLDPQSAGVPQLSDEEIQGDLVSLAAPSARALPTEITRTRFAVEIGAAESMGDARDLWRTLSRENRPLIGALDPVVAIAEIDGEMVLRLLAGPFQNAADAVQLCVLLVGRGVDCRAVPSEGQKLVMQ